MSAPTASHTAATALTKLIFVARKALAAYLIVSAEAGSVTMSGAAMPRYSDGHPHRRRLVVGADDDAVGVQEVVDGGALPEELRVRHDVHVGTAEHPLDDPGRAHRHRRLVDDDGVGRERRADLGGGRLDVGEVGRAVGALRRRHAQVDELGSAAARVAGLKRRRPPDSPSRSRLSRPCSRIGHSPAWSRSMRSASTSVQTTVVAEVGEAGRRGQPDVAATR